MTVAFSPSEAAKAHRRSWVSPRVLVLAIGLVCAALLAAPGITVTTRSLDELFLTIDGIHRVMKGQIPSLDFQTSLGPLAYYGPAAGYGLTGSLGAAMPVTMALATAHIALIASHVLISRLHPFLATVLAAFLLLILAAPMNLGEAVTALSFAMFYNRIGWVALALLLVLYLSPQRVVRHQMFADGICAAALAIVMIYLRATYGLVALGFLLFMVTDRPQRAWVGLAVILIAASLLLVEGIWGGSSAYAINAWREMQETSVLAGNLLQLLRAAVAHLPDLLLLSLLAGLALWRRWKLRDLFFFLFCSIAGLWLLSLNVQRWGIISIHAAAAVAAERLLRAMEEPSANGEGTFVNRSGVKLYFLAFVLPTALHCGMALTLHAGAAAARAGQALELPRMSGTRLANLWTDGDFGGGTAYLATVRDGLSLLSRQNDPIGPIAVVGSADAFSAALDLPPGEGEVIDLRWQSLGAPDVFPPARALAGVDTVMFRKPGETPAGAAAEYLAFVNASYTRIGESEHWMLFRRDHAPPGFK